jgi:hypothetical protein
MPFAPFTTPLRAVLQSDPLALLTGLGMDLGPELGPELSEDSIVSVPTGVYPVDCGVLGITLTPPELLSTSDPSTSQIVRNVRSRNSTYSGIAIELAGDIVAFQYLQLRSTHAGTGADDDINSGSGCRASRHCTESDTATASLLSRAISTVTKQLR